MTSEHYRRLSEFGEFLRKAFGGIREESRIHRHLVSCDLNELWSWAHAHPEALSGPLPIEARK